MAEMTNDGAQAWGRQAFARAWNPWTPQAARGRRLVAALLFALAVSSNARAEESAEAGERERAIDLFGGGNAAFAAGEIRQARDLYEQAWQLSPSYDIACNLGRAEAELKRWPMAAPYLHYCLTKFSVSNQAELRAAEARFRELFGEVLTRVGRLDLDIAAAGATVEIDNVASQGLEPGAPQFVNPGRHRVRVAAPGRQPYEVSLELAAGGHRALSIDLEPLAEPSAPMPASGSAVVAAPSPQPELAAPSNARTAVLITGGSLALVGVGVGVGFALDYRSAGNRADALRDSIEREFGANGCAQQPGAASCQQLDATLDRRESSGRWATIGFVTGGMTALATALSWWLWPVPESYAIAPSYWVGGAGAMFSARY